MVDAAVSPDGNPDLSVVIPMYNEGENACRTAELVCATLREAGVAFEVICVDDGSTDDTLSELEQASLDALEVRVVSYIPNRGRGYALRTGLAAAAGKYIVSVDADLSYSPEQILNLLERLKQSDNPDIVIGSPYMPGGRTEGVRAYRLFISRCANILLRQAMGRRYYTITGIFRGYRRQALDCIELYSDGKEIHLEIVAKAEAAGLRLVEEPAVLSNRKLGSSKLSLRITVLSHLMFSFYEKPILLFGVVGLLLTLTSFVLGGYLFTLYLNSALNPTRPMVWLSVLLLLAGIQMASFAFISSQITALKRELFRTQKQILLLRRDTSGPGR